MRRFDQMVLVVEIMHALPSETTAWHWLETTMGTTSV
jgi:hypothetical protein